MENVAIIILTIIIILICSAIGGIILEYIGYRGPRLSQFSISYLIGLATMLLLIALFGLRGELTLEMVVAIFIFFTIIFFLRLVKFVREFPAFLWQNLQSLRHWPWDEIVTLFFISSVIIAQGLASLAIPTNTDAVLTYLPTATALISNESLIHPEPLNYYFSNITLFPELLFTFASLFDQAMAALSQYSILLACLGYWYSWIKNFFSRKVALWSLAGATLLYPLFFTATTLTIRNAHIALEFTAVLLFLEWWKFKQNSITIVSSLIFVFAIMNNFTALFSAVLCTLVIIAYCLRKKIIQPIKAFLLPLIILITMIITIQYKLDSKPNIWLISSEQSILARREELFTSVANSPMILYPYRLFLNLYEASSDVQVLFVNLVLLVALGIMGIIWLKKQTRSIIYGLLAYVVSYTIFWFFFTNHYIRFTEMISLGLVVLGTIGFANLPWRWARFGYAGIVCVYLLFSYPRSTIVEAISTTLYRSSEVSNAIGLTDDNTYISKYTDCSYEMALYIKNNSIPGIILDNWSTGYDRLYMNYTKQEQFYPLPSDVSSADLPIVLKEGHMNYMMVRGPAKAWYERSGVGDQILYYNQRITQEETLLQSAKPIYSFEDCILYQIDPV